jgi:hypothetical protein
MVPLRAKREGKKGKKKEKKKRKRGDKFFGKGGKFCLYERCVERAGKTVSGKAGEMGQLW